MIRKVEVGSVFGTAQRTSYKYMKFLNKKTNGNFKTLVVDDKDGPKQRFRNKSEIENAIRNINDEMEEAQKEFSKLFQNDNSYTKWKDVMWLLTRLTIE